MRRWVVVAYEHLELSRHWTRWGAMRRWRRGQGNLVADGYGDTAEDFTVEYR